MAQDAIRGYLQSLRMDRQPIPPDLAPLSEEVQVILPEPAEASASPRFTDARRPNAWRAAAPAPTTAAQSEKSPR